jgi:alcohol dehydrogenase class IV
MAVPKKFAKVAELMGEKIQCLTLMDAAKKSVEAVRSLARDLDMTLKMSDVGIMKSDIPEMAEERFTAMGHVMESNNPRNVTREDMVQVLYAAF